MPLSDHNKTTLLVSIHKWIEESADASANHIYNGRLSQLINYPPNGGLTREELDALGLLKGNDHLKSALRKVFASSTSDVFFQLFNVIDGTSDPDPGTGEWSEVALVDKPENEDEDVEFLHDDLFGSYWEWKAKRKNSNWTLDLGNGG